MAERHSGRGVHMIGASMSTPVGHAFNKTEAVAEYDQDVLREAAKAFFKGLPIDHKAVIAGAAEHLGIDPYQWLMTCVGDAVAVYLAVLKTDLRNTWEAASPPQRRVGDPR